MSDALQEINAVEFVDLYLGKDYSDIKGLAGTQEARVPAPEGLRAAFTALREKCLEMYQGHGEPEFALTIGKTVFRITQYSDMNAESVFIVRRSSAQLRPFASLGFSSAVMRHLLSKELSGLVLVAGDMATGKTSTAASLLVSRLEVHGGVAMAIEDPPETLLNGVHGGGRCIQVPASRKSGGYKEHMTRGMRSGVNFMLIGEIRDEDTSVEVVKAGINGNLIVATLHGGSVEQAIERLHAMCSGRLANAYEILAQGLAAVIWQDLEKDGKVSRLVFKTLIFDDPAIRTRVAKGEIAKLAQDVHNQANRTAWGNSSGAFKS